MFSILLAVLTLTTVPGEGSSGTKGNVYVDAAISLTDSTIQQGDSVTIRAILSPADGIHINADPPASFALKGTREAALVGDASFSVNKENGFLATGDPVEQQFTIARNAATGTDTVRGSLIYYFCSDTEGWCRKYTQPFSFPIHILAK
jgi:hypothetical protein